MLSPQLLTWDASTGCVTVPLLCAGFLIPYTLGLNDPPEPLRLKEKIRLSPRDRLKKLKLHHWIGCMAVAATLVHAVIPTVSGVLGKINSLGLWCGVVSAVALLLQVPLGIFLRKVTLLKRRRWRRLHFWLAVTCVATLIVHVYYNCDDLGHISNEHILTSRAR